jgi:PASTA domain/Calcineurin-like phosphoesterase
MRVAALYVIHGNLPALEAVLSEVDQDAPDLIVVGGDAASGPMPKETLDRLLALEGRARFIRGNTDRELVDHYDGISMLRETVGEDNVWVRRGEWAAQQITEAQRNVLVAKVVGKRLGAAKLAIKRRHCRTGSVGYAYSHKAKKGIVISQSRRPGKVLPANSKINLVVSRGSKR